MMSVELWSGPRVGGVGGGQGRPGAARLEAAPPRSAALEASPWALWGEAGALVLELRWLRPGRVAVALSLQGVAVAVLGAVAEGHGGRALRFGLFLLVTVGAYVAAAVALNRTRIRAGGGWLTVAHGPLPFPGWGPRTRAVARAEMSQFAVQGRPDRAELWLRLRSGRALHLASFPTTALALAVEATLRQQLEQPAPAAPRPLRARGLHLLVAGTCLLITLGLLHRLVLA
jgi:hypothetical protein